MFLESFVFTTVPPEQLPVDGGYPMVARDGIFLAPGYPYQVNFGIFLELAAEEDEWGQFELRIDIEMFNDGQNRTMWRHPFGVAEPVDDWTMSRAKVLPFEIDFTAEADVEFAVKIFVDDEFLGDKLGTVVLCDVPDFPAQ